MGRRSWLPALKFHFCLYFIRTLDLPLNTNFIFSYSPFPFVSLASNFHICPSTLLDSLHFFPPCLIFLPLILTSLQSSEAFNVEGLTNTIGALTHSGTFRGSAQFCSSSPLQIQNKKKKVGRGWRKMRRKRKTEWGGKTRKGREEEGENFHKKIASDVWGQLDLSLKHQEVMGKCRIKREE